MGIVWLGGMARYSSAALVGGCLASSIVRSRAGGSRTTHPASRRLIRKITAVGIDDNACPPWQIPVCFSGRPR
ncbi:hypothetical protein BJY01DRAFT_214285 [Aspergillus pseudoustus]|uniref:Secreted protein n=1 Tax=Aspergillus pseudoustus TaxID=1810923 RepID=A0ABR4JZG2_9EURO